MLKSEDRATKACVSRLRSLHTVPGSDAHRAMIDLKPFVEHNTATLPHD